MNDLEGLKRLQKGDREIGKLRKQVAELTSGHKEIEAGIAKMQALLPKVTESLVAAQKVVKTKEADVQELQAKKGKLDGKLKQAVTSKAASAIQLEITTANERTAAAEEVVLGAMEKEEEAQAMVDKVTGGIALLQKKLADHHATKDGKTAGLRAEVDRLMVERTKWRGYIGEADLAHYDKLVGDNLGKVVVCEVEEACGICDLHFPPDRRETLMRHADKAHKCPGCSSLMLFEGAVSI